MATKSDKKTEKINFLVSEQMKQNIELLASSYNKNLSAFMLDVCSQLIKSNSQRIKEQKARASEPINFGGNVQTSKTVKTKKAKSTGKTTDGGTPTSTD